MNSESKEIVRNCKSIREAFQSPFEKYDKHVAPHNKKPNKFMIKKGRLNYQKEKITGFETKKDNIKSTVFLRVDFDPIKKTHINFSTISDKFAFSFPCEENHLINLINELTFNFSTSEGALGLIEKFRSFCN